MGRRGAPQHYDSVPTGNGRGSRKPSMAMSSYWLQLTRFEIGLIQFGLREAAESVSRAAEILGVDRKFLARRCKALGISIPVTRLAEQAALARATRDEQARVRERETADPETERARAIPAAPVPAPASASDMPTPQACGDPVPKP